MQVIDPHQSTETDKYLLITNKSTYEAVHSTSPHCRAKRKYLNI